jgi:signal transduction histidine kinase
VNHSPAESLSTTRVLIISDEPEFARTLIARWHSERHVPSFTQLGSELWNGAQSAAWDLAIVGPVQPVKLDAVLATLESALAPIVCMVPDAESVPSVRAVHPRVSVLRRHDTWPDTVVLLSGEILRRFETGLRMQQAERTVALSERYATLGRYMLDMRHSFNNAMTSVLGNAELLLLEPAALSAQVREQIETIRTMAMRMHEIMQRFSSLEAEMRFAERAAQHDPNSATVVAHPNA